MTVQDLARMVIQCRNAQRNYFESRSPQDLRVAKDFERKLDAAARAVLNPQNPGLFDEPIKEGT